LVTIFCFIFHYNRKDKSTKTTNKKTIV